MPKSSHWKNMFWAFVVGGTICTIGQALIEFYKIWFELQDASVLASATLVFIAALLTGFGVYDNIGRFAGAGSTIPITGFSNAVVSPALEFRAEGYIYGVGAKMFQIAGPVIVNGGYYFCHSSNHNADTRRNLSCSTTKSAQSA